MKQYLMLIQSACVLFLTACDASHVHNRGVLPDNKVAYIKGVPGWNPLSSVAVDIYRIDGRKINTGQASYEVLPGEHEVSVSCTINQPEYIKKYYLFTIPMKAGHSYRPKLDMTKECYLDYIDTNTGMVYKGKEN